MTCHALKSTPFNCYFPNRRPKQGQQPAPPSGFECRSLKPKTSGRPPVREQVLALYLIVNLLTATIAVGADTSPDAKSPFDKKPTAFSPFDKKPTTKSPFDKKPTTKSPFDKKPTTKSSINKTPASQPPSIERVRELETSDGVRLEMAYYPPKGKAIATVILVHDLNGSEKTVRRLAAGLQEAGCAVAVPDLRGHGNSKSEDYDISKKKLLVNQIRMIPASGGGRIRSHARIKGDLETVRNWLKQKESEGDIDLDQLCVIGSGLGGTLAAMWAVADWHWLPNTQGPQGQQVKAVILISPVWADQGVSMTNALGARIRDGRGDIKPLLEGLPVLIIAGTNDRQSGQLFQRLKGARPMNWSQESADGTKQQSKRKPLRNQNKAGPLVFEEIRSSLRADKLASLPSGNRTPLQLCVRFIEETLPAND
ncbi:MAG: alpha/beta fold hydrolase [Planctomycetaceae bacterium]|nr:alpha/beta fold hydrolase [Planctomycetaceae bacterium]